MLQVRNVTKWFGDVKVLDRISFTLNRLFAEERIRFRPSAFVVSFVVIFPPAISTKKTPQACARGVGKTSIEFLLEQSQQARGPRHEPAGQWASKAVSPG